MTGELSAARLAAYAAPSLPLAILTLPLYALVPNFYAVNVGLSIALVGQVLLVVRLVDALFDPFAGYLTDRTRSRFGRRKIWVVAGFPVAALAAVMVFMPPQGAGAGYLLFWGSLLSLGWTLILVPYSAWGAELSQTYSGRDRVAAAREGLAFVGTLLALIVQAVTADLATTLMVFALVIVVGLPVTTLIAVAFVPEPEDRTVEPLSFMAGLGYMRENIPFVRLVIAFLVNGLANGLPATLFLFFVVDKLGATQAQAGQVLVLYFICGVIGVPFWLWRAKTIGKHRAWCHSMVVACLAFAVAPFLGPGDIAAFAAVCVVTGLCVGADLVLPASLQADVIDVDTARSGEQRSGLYLAVWGLATKLALALAVGIAFPILGASGFDPQAGLKTETGLLALGLLYA
ncbi:MAG: MFS transporter, partial [Alphaproteobacteria bacterium]